MAGMNPVPEDVLDALSDLAAGRLQRSRHDLVWEGRDLTPEFEAVLAKEGFAPLRLRDLAVPRGVRFPAFVLRQGTAHFGHVFREKFTESEDRLLFGSVARDGRGDWDVMLTRRSTEPVWVAMAQGTAFDEDRPSGGR